VTPDAVDVEYEHPQPDPDLRRGQSGPAFGPQRLGQIADQTPQRPVEIGDRIGPGPQHWIAEQPDLTDRRRHLPRHPAGEPGRLPRPEGKE
jgi:hypothetical protein